MKNFILLSKKVLIFCFLICSLSFFAQTTFTVNNNPNVSTDFTDLQAAINDGSVMDGDILYVQHSPTTYGNITLNKELIIIGRSHSDTGYRTSIGNISLADGSSNSIIRGVHINAVNHTGGAASFDGISFFDNDINNINIGSSNFAVSNLLVQGNVIRSTITINSNSSNITITNNLIFSSSIVFYMVDSLFFSNNLLSYSNGTTFTNNATTNSLLNISDCIFVLNNGSTRTVTLSRNGTNTIQIDNCVTYNYGAGSYNFETDTYITINGNVQENTDPLFTAVTPGVVSSLAGTSNVYDELNDDMTLQGGSPVTDDGLYENYNFLNLGVPTGYPSLKITTYDPKIPKNGTLSVTIEAKTN